MGVRVAYGKRDRVTAAIRNGVIPIDSIIIAKDDDDSAGLMFYDKSTNLVHIVAKTRFTSMEEACDYAAVMGGVGTVVTVLEGDKYSAYIVQPSGELEPIGGGSVPQEEFDNLLERVGRLETAAHSHENQTVLDGISETQVQSWNTLVERLEGILNGDPVPKSSEELNGVRIKEDGTMEVNEIGISKLVQESDTELVIDGGGM